MVHYEKIKEDGTRVIYTPQQLIDASVKINALTPFGVGYKKTEDNSENPKIYTREQLINARVKNNNLNEVIAKDDIKDWAPSLYSGTGAESFIHLVQGLTNIGQTEEEAKGRGSFRYKDKDVLSPSLDLANVVLSVMPGGRGTKTVGNILTGLGIGVIADKAGRMTSAAIKNTDAPDIVKVGAPVAAGILTGGVVGAGLSQPIGTIKKTSEPVINAAKKVGVEISKSAYAKNMDAPLIKQFYSIGRRIEDLENVFKHKNESAYNKWVAENQRKVALGIKKEIDSNGELSLEGLTDIGKSIERDLLNLKKRYSPEYEAHQAKMDTISPEVFPTTTSVPSSDVIKWYETLSPTDFADKMKKTQGGYITNLQSNLLSDLSDANIKIGSPTFDNPGTRFAPDVVDYEDNFTKIPDDRLRDLYLTVLTDSGKADTIEKLKIFKDNIEKKAASFLPEPTSKNYGSIERLGKRLVQRIDDEILNNYGRMYPEDLQKYLELNKKYSEVKKALKAINADKKEFAMDKIFSQGILGKDFDTVKNIAEQVELANPGAMSRYGEAYIADKIFDNSTLEDTLNVNALQKILGVGGSQELQKKWKTILGEDKYKKYESISKLGEAVDLSREQINLGKSLEYFNPMINQAASIIDKIDIFATGRGKTPEVGVPTGWDTLLGPAFISAFRGFTGGMNQPSTFVPAGAEKNNKDANTKK